MTLLQNEMFDDGSFECFNFWIADQDGTYQIGADDALIVEMRSRIEARMKLGFSHIDTRRLELVYGGVQVFEIQWG
jgi:hypothetical protein